MTSTGGLIVLAAALFAAVPGRAADQPRPKYPERTLRSIAPVNAPTSYVVVSGTVTVRARGVLVNPQEVTFVFQPEFPGSRGYLYRVAEGTYRLEVPRVPGEAAHTLVISAAYNDTIVKGDVIQRLGETYSGTLRLEVPNGRDFAFGEQLLDLR